MGYPLNLQRFSHDVGIDLLALRRRFQDVDVPEVYAPFHPLYDPPPDVPPRTFGLIFAEVNVDLAMLVGLDCEAFHTSASLWDWHSDHETDDPRIWATRGARRSGWMDYVPGDVGAGERPLRYSIRDDMIVIRQALDRLSVDEMRANLDACLDEGIVVSDRKRSGPDRDRLMGIVPHFLTSLTMFYDAAIENDEIAITFMLAPA